MLGAGIEPAWGCPRGILSPLRLPVSPPERTAPTANLCADSDRYKNDATDYALSPSAWEEYHTRYAINPDIAASPPLPTALPS